MPLTFLGVDMSAQPTNYSYMNPGVRMELDRAAYGDPNAIPRVEQWLSSSDDGSGVICFKEVSLVLFRGDTNPSC